MAPHLFVVQDDLMFAQRALLAARRLAVTADLITPTDAATRPWNATDVVLLQATLRPQAQLALVDRILGREPRPVVVAVTGHLETDLRRQLKARRVRLATHSAMDRALARALELNDARNAGDAHPSPPPRS